MKHYNLAPNVLCTTAKNRVLKANIEGGFPENWWDEGDAEKLVKEGFLVEIGGVPYVKPVKPLAEENPPVSKEVDVPNDKKLIPYVNLKKEQLMEILSLRGVEFESDANKQTLYQLYKQ